MERQEKDFQGLGVLGGGIFPISNLILETYLEVFLVMKDLICLVREEVDKKKAGILVMN